MVADKTTQTEDTADVLEPAVAHRTQTLGLEPNVMTYVQKPLSFFQKMEIFSVLGSALDKAMSGPDGLSIDQLMDGPRGLGDSITAENVRDADTFIRAISKLVQFAPELFLDLYVIILGVPRGDRDYVKEVINLPASDGGLADDDGIAILETFIDQNWDVMVDFFTVQIQPLIKKVSQKVSGSAPSKPSKTTQRRTAKQ